MKKILPLVFLVALGAHSLVAQNAGTTTTTTSTTDGKAGPAPTGVRVAPPADIAEMLQLEDERAAIRQAIIADLKAAEKQAASAVKARGKEAGAAIRAAAVQKQQDRETRLKQIVARLQALRPDTKATQPERIAR
jgi:hypothetical protein